MLRSPGQSHSGGHHIQSYFFRDFQQGQNLESSSTLSMAPMAKMGSWS